MILPKKTQILSIVFTIVTLIVIALTLQRGKFTFTSRAASGEPIMPGDLNNDGIVNIQDAVILSNSFGKKAGDSGYNESANINKDGIVNIQDAEVLSNNFIE